MSGPVAPIPLMSGIWVGIDRQMDNNHQPAVSKSETFREPRCASGRDGGCPGEVLSKPASSAVQQTFGHRPCL